MFYPQEVIQDVRALNDIVDVVGSYVQLRLQGGRHIGLCPFHNEKTPSFHVNGDRQMFHCFGCHAGGNVITFIMRHENMDFLDAFKLLADRVHYSLPDQASAPSAQIRAKERERTAELNKQAARFYYEQLQQDTPEAEMTRSYLQGRGVHISLQKRFGLGLAPPGWDNLITHIAAPGPELATAGLAVQSQKNQSRYYDRFRRRLIFPIIESTGRVVGFGGRALPGGEDGEAKYINSPDTPLYNKSRQLYGLNLARKAGGSEMIIVEGYMDVLALHQAGFTNTVGVLGTALTGEHVRLIKRASKDAVTLLLDSDEAGTRAAVKAIPELIKGGLDVKVLQFSPETGAKDPDDYLQLHGRENFSRLLASAKSHVAFQVENLKKHYALDNDSETNKRIRFTEEAASLLTGLASAIETDAYAQEIADISGIAPTAIMAEVQKQRARAIKSEDGQPLIIPTRTRPRMHTGTEEKGLREARRGLLNLVLTHPEAANALLRSGYLSPHEMSDETYSQLLVLAFENAENKRHISPADITAHFEILEDHQKIAEIFAHETLCKSAFDIEKDLNTRASIIKHAWINAQMYMHANDKFTLKNLQETKRNLSSLYITMSDG